MRRGILLERANQRTGNALPPAIRRDKNTLDLGGLLVDLLPCAAARRFSILIRHHAGIQQVWVVVFRIAAMHLTDNLKIILVKLLHQRQQIGVFGIDKPDFHACHSFRNSVISTASSVGAV